MKRYSGNNSSLGTASHLELHYPSNSSTATRRSRNKCKYYNPESKWCSALKASCVGPSNELCQAYEEATSQKKKDGFVNAIVNDPKEGVGMVVRSFGPGFFEVKYHETGLVRKYTYSELKKILLNPSHCKKSK